MSSNHSQSPSAGSAEPYWFEWETGLLSLIEMLDEDSDVVSVGFQLHGTKGWDDVGVMLRNGTTRLMQIKHSRVGDNFTFGDLVGDQQGEASLLKTLAGAWKTERRVRGSVECLLKTNRLPGPNWHRGSPPLALFFEKLSTAAADLLSIDDIRWDGEDERFQGAWSTFLGELDMLGQVEKLEFIKAFSVEASAPDLDQIEIQLKERLVALTGLSLSSVHPLFNTLLANLSKWACQTRRESEWIDREALRSCLVGAEGSPRWLGHCEVETPNPFFPSREDIVNVLKMALTSPSSGKIHFLSAEPGAGKTSCISRLSRSGSVLWKDQCISIRFYAYRPIRPGEPDIGNDFGEGVRPEALWLGLLWQIRDNLRKSRLLGTLAVPVWLDGMPWEVARGHVLRLAELLGEKWDRPFVICIDGLDHAARARRAHLPEFLRTLPTPETLSDHVKLLIGGQPAESFPEYPFFLRQDHQFVVRHSIDDLTDEDLLVLWQAANHSHRLPSAYDDGAVRLLEEYAHRRTLPTVYAAEDIKDCATLAAAASLLASRPLADSLSNYYDGIWTSVSNTEGDISRLAAAFSMLRERPTGALMASAFSDLGRSATEWIDVMRRLRPLVRETPQGFELVHNDLRVHLSAGLATQAFVLKDAASALADYYRRSSNRHAAHATLPDLLITANRRDEFADDFTTKWVVEAGELGLDDERLAAQCAMAFEGAVHRKDLLLLHAVACASLTVNRLHECTTTWPTDEDPLSTPVAPLFLAFEGETQPLELWNEGSFLELVSSAERLLDSGATTRAAAVLKQWIGDITAEQLVDGLLSTLLQEEENHRDKLFCQELEKFGRLCALCDIPVPYIDRESERHFDQFEAMESGWVDGNAEDPNRLKALRKWVTAWPMFNNSWFKALEEAARRSRWGEVRALLNRMEGCVDDVGPVKRIEFAWHATRSRAKNLETWRAAMNLPDYGLVHRSASLGTLCTIARCVTYNSVIREFSQVAEELIPLLDVHDLNPRKSAAILLVLQASGVIGRMLRYVDQEDIDGVRTAVPPHLLERYLSALWCKEPDWRNLPHNEINAPSKVAESLAGIARSCGDAYQSLLIRIARERFPGVILQQEGLTAFAVLREGGEDLYLKSAVTDSARELLLHLHEHDAPSRNGIIRNLLRFTDILGLTDLNLELAARLKKTRMGYACHKEWVFQPLIRWFEVLRKSEPGLWRTHGIQIIRLDEIAGEQGADNRFDSELMTETATAAIACGPDHFETLFQYLASSTSKYPLANLRTVAREGLANGVIENVLNDDAVLSLMALAVAVGRWPEDSAATTVGYFGENLTDSLNGHADVLNKAAAIAASMQGTSAPEPLSPSPQSSDQIEISRSLTTLSDGMGTPIAPDLRLADIAALVEKANVENTPHRDVLVAKALEALERADALNRCLDFHDIRTISKFTTNLNEDELWRMLAAITSLTGDLRKELDIDPQWAFSVAFSAIDLTCRSLVEKGAGIGRQAFEQLLETHWKWHGLSEPATSLSVPDTGSTWQEVVRRSLFALMQTDACETLYMAMAGMRFFTEAFPSEIPVICRDGLADDRAKDAVVALALLWATRCPEALDSSASAFKQLESCGTLDERLDAWLVGALRNVVNGIKAADFSIPEQEISPTISFPGDTQLFEIPSERNGLISHSAFPDMANKRLRRAALVIGSPQVAFRKMARMAKESPTGSPSFYLGPAKKLAWDTSYPRPSRYLAELVGDAIMYQCSGQSWAPGDAAATRLAMGNGMDPWIASAPPNQWHEKEGWPSDYDAEKWFESGAAQANEVGTKLAALRDGKDLDPFMIQLGAVLHVPTYLRDITFFQWLVPTQREQAKTSWELSTIPYGKTVANWLGGWSPFAADMESSVHFSGSLVNYPTAELEVTPTDCWERFWQWLPDPGNPLQFLSRNGTPVSRYERWHCSNGYTKSVTRLPSLYRWVARRDSFPPVFEGLSGWQSKTKTQTRMLSSPE